MNTPIHIDVKSIRDKLDAEWYAEYSSLQMSYPFFMWVGIRYQARLNRFDNKFELIFQDEELAKEFIKKWDLDAPKD